VDRARAFGMHTEIIDGQDVRQVYETARELVARARAGEGPAFLQCDTYRYYGHHVGDISREYYRSKKEEEEWKSQRDPLQLLEDWLLETGATDKSILEKIRNDAAREIEEKAQWALDAPYPDPDEVDQHVYS